ncbi:hypothetical protein Tsubulata_034273 [Turnera subulata]|uniref:5'-3' exonuclease domain-containing protein n=1 Tax=Turnera subulata TaxID=218843 RepID=A0A9Q0F9E7_9ROSI|nr:hypothetical protein Tsubulata_034273 [Turnera subulata]
MIEITATVNFNLKLSIPTANKPSTKPTLPKPPSKSIRCAASNSPTPGSFKDQTFNGKLLTKSELYENNGEKRVNKRRVFLLDVNPLCYDAGKPSLDSFGYWISLFFSRVSLSDPVIAVLDGEGGSQYRRGLLPSYKAHRKRFYVSPSHQWSKNYTGRFKAVIDVLTRLNVPVVKVEGYEADDVVATLLGQVLRRGYSVVVASPDKDFKQLVSTDVQMVLPIPELKRWSFYTLKDYIAQYKLDPCSDLSLRCIMGDESDGIPGIQTIVPGFGRKTALKLLKKHGSLENLLNAAAVRTVGKQFVQDAVTKYADFLRRNYEVLALRTDIDVQLQEDWLAERKSSKDSTILSGLDKLLEESKRSSEQNRSHSLYGQNSRR